MVTGRAFFLAVGTYVLVAVLGLCVVAVLVPLWFAP